MNLKGIKVGDPVIMTAPKYKGGIETETGEVIRVGRKYLTARFVRVSARVDGSVHRYPYEFDFHIDTGHERTSYSNNRNLWTPEGYRKREIAEAAAKAINDAGLRIDWSCKHKEDLDMLIDLADFLRVNGWMK